MDEINGYNVDIIVPEVQRDEIVYNRGKNMDKERLKKIHKALLTFHNLENMAANIYRFQICKKNSNELNQELITAMLNEMGHIQDFQVKLYEFGFKPSLMMYAYQIVGFIFGIFSRIPGPGQHFNCHISFFFVRCFFFCLKNPAYPFYLRCLFR